MPREFYSLDELAVRMKCATISGVLSTAANVEMTVSRLFSGPIVGSIGNIFDSTPYDKVAVDELKKSVLRGDALPFHVGYIHLRKDEVIAAALRINPSEKFATAWITADNGKILLLPEDNLYSNNDLFVLAGEVDRIKAEYPDLFKPATQSDSDNGQHQSGIDDEYSTTNTEIEHDSGMSFNTFVKWARLAGVPIGRTEGNNPQNKILKADIRRVKSFRKEYPKKSKK